MMQTTVIVILAIVCLALARACQVLYATLKSERDWADHPASFFKLVERMCHRADKGTNLSFFAPRFVRRSSCSMIVGTIESDKMNPKPFVWPDEVTHERVILPSGVCVTLSHVEIGMLGRFILTPHAYGGSRFDCEILGTGDQTTIDRRRSILEPLAREASARLSGRS